VKNQFEHNHREANQVADKLARMAMRHDQNMWLDDPPSSFIPLLLKDVTYVVNEV
jgi:hypothetical protein